MKTHGYYIIQNPELGVFGPFEPNMVTRAAVDAGHAKEDDERTRSEISRRVASATRALRSKRVAEARSLSASLVPDDMRAAANLIEGLPAEVDAAEKLAHRRISNALPLLIEADVIETFRWEHKKRVERMLVDMQAEPVADD